MHFNKAFRFKYLIVAVMVLTNFGCAMHHDESIDVFGIYCGMCYGICAPTIIHYNDSSFLDISDNFFDEGFYYNPYNSEFLLRLDDSIHQIINNLMVSGVCLNDLDSTIGCPDCRDQCGYYYKINNKSWRIDPDNYPKELTPLINATDSIYNLVFENYDFNLGRHLGQKNTPDSLAIIILSTKEILFMDSAVSRVSTNDKIIWKLTSENEVKKPLIIVKKSINEITDSNIYNLRDLYYSDIDSINARYYNDAWNIIE